jgi:hypothetical protein
MRRPPTQKLFQTRRFPGYEDFALFRRAGGVRTVLFAAVRVELFRAVFVARAARFFAGDLFAGRFVAVRFTLARFLFGARFWPTRSGSSLRPVERFHSSYCSSVIFPSTSSCANLRRWALLLNGILGF